MDDTPPKRKRLSYACNHCRQKKTRCDEQQPSCRNCRIAGVPCITTDKRRAGAVVAHRRRLTAAAPSESTVVTTPSSQSQPSPLLHVRLPAQCWDRAGWRSGRLPMMPRFVGGCMFEIMTEWLDLAFYRLRLPVPYTPSSPGPASISLPEAAPVLPSSPELRVLGQNFLQTVGHILPFLSPEDINRLCDLTPASSSEHALVYLIATVGLLTGPEPQSKAATYINYCNTLLGHTIAERSLHSVQAILLFAIVLRSCDHIAWAWDVLCLGVSTAQSIGIHQTRPGSEKQVECARTWWCLYVFEKILAFESGRVSTICDRELSRPVQQEDALGPGEGYRWACISLANTLHEMQDRAAGAWRREEWLPQTVDEAIEEKIQTGGELATLLEGWWRGLPSEYQLGSSERTSQPAAFLSFYYCYALILLNRSVLLIESSEIRDVIERYASGQPWKHRIANGASVCVEAAREMVKLTVAIVDSGLPAYLTALTLPLPAVYALAVHILRERHSLLIRSDFELMKAGIAIIKRHYRRLDGVARVDEVLSALEAYTAQCLDGHVTQPFGPGHGELQQSSPSSSLPAEPAMANLGWGPSALDWAGWDWNDVSHLFENSE
ncbi:hypothetical protein BDW62DRAFT_205152 [Aspergillus aurantiobrunneus]